MIAITPRIFCLSLCFVLSLRGMGSAQTPPPSQWKWVNEDIAEGCQHATLHSSSMQRKIGYSVYLPPSYEVKGNQRFPVVYYLHGASGSEASSKEFAWAVRQAIAKGDIGDVIYVFPNGGHYSGYRDWDDGTVKAETWLIKELIPHVDATYRTIPNREGRALCGWSMGGDGSMRFLAKYPDMFCAAATMSAALGYQKGSSNDTATQHLVANADKLRGRVGIWMAVGENDFLKARNEAFAAKLKDLQIEHKFQILPDTGHNLGALSGKYHREIVTMLADHYAEATEQDRLRRPID